MLRFLQYGSEAVLSVNLYSFFLFCFVFINVMMMVLGDDG